MGRLFSDSLKRRQAAGLVPVILDIKCRSPKEGDLLRGRDPVQTARMLAAAGAPALSVVTEAAHFGGSLDLLKTTVQATGLPVLRKDFIRDQAAVAETARAGAAAILLIAAMLDRPLLTRLYHQALELGLEPLVETHTADELAFAASLKASLTGINNRDIRQLEKDSGTVQATAELAGRKPSGSVLVSESAIATPSDVRRAIANGTDAVLVGTALWQAEDMILLYRQLSQARPTLKICGLTQAGDVALCLDAGVDILGFVTEYPLPVPWNLTRQQAARLVQTVRDNNRSSRSCLVTGGRPAAVVSLASELHPHLVQLHHQETLAETRQIAEALQPLGIGVIQAIPGDPVIRQARYGTADIASAVEALNQTAVYALLADMRSPANAAQADLVLDPAFCRAVVAHAAKPVMVAGGLTPDRIEATVAATGTAFIDIMSGVEIRPGVKDPKHLRQAAEAMRHL
ncbi:MAG: hypothetical protein GX112_01055 [Clostridiaceae bacterium]|jgi:indole-3-glycerol phosphate synthase/phosphoribosylanthranilate isomerase|nr:hypothetical protein [Clostridiaceae bacterium]